MQQPYDFIFVNKHATSATLSCGTEFSDSAIQRHVQIVSARANQAKRIKSLRASSWAARKIAREGFRLKQRCKEAEEEEEEIFAGESRASTRFEDDEKALIKSYAPEHATRSAVRCIVPGNSIDPFNSTVAKFSSTVVSILRFHLSSPFMVCAIRRPHASQLDAQHRHSSAANEVVKGCLANEMNLYALLAAGSERFTLFTGKRVPEANRFMQKAILAMQKYLGGPHVIINSKLVLNICLLGFAERLRENHSAVLIHFQVLKSVIDSLDPNQAFDRYIFDLICVTDVLNAVQSATKPYFELTWQPKPLPTSRIEEVNLELNLFVAETRQRRLSSGRTPEPDESEVLQDESKRSTDRFNSVLAHQQPRFAATKACDVRKAERGLLEAANAGGFQEGLIQIISEILLYFDFATWVTHCTSISNDDKEWCDRTLLAILGRLVSVSATGLEECCRLALIIMLSYATTPLAWQTAKPNMFRLKEAITVLEQGSSNGIHELSGLLGRLSLWILMVGLFATTAAPEEEEWFMSRACRIASHLEMRSIFQLRQLTGSFMQYETLQLKARSLVELRQLTGYFLQYETLPWACLSRLAARITTEAQSGAGTRS